MNKLEVTDIRLFPISGSDKILANGTVTYNDSIVVRVKVWNGSQGREPWVGYEGQRADIKNKETGEMEKKWFDAWFFKDKEAKQNLLTEPVLSAYYKRVNGNNASSQTSSQTSNNASSGPSYGRSRGFDSRTASDEIPF